MPNRPARSVCRAIQARAALPVLAASMSLVAVPASAVVVAGDPGQNAPVNTSAPTGFEDAWNRVGSLGGGSGVYLGNGYVLSARHVNGGGTFTIDGFAHSRISGTSVTFTNPSGSGLSAEADLWINRYAVPDNSPLSGMGVIAMRDTPLADAGAGFVIIGEGLGQTTLTPINVGGALGYAWGNGEQRRWGDISVGSSVEVDVNDRDILGVRSFNFREQHNRSTAAAGDSGGGLFSLVDGSPVLDGIIHAVSTLSGQDDDTSAFNTRTFFSDLTHYSDQIHVVEGDLTGDGWVDINDLDLILANWGQSVQAGNWTLGDATGDGLVGQGDLNLVIANFGSEEPIPSAVPEPGTGVVLGLALLLGVGRRRRPVFSQIRPVLIRTKG